MSLLFILFAGALTLLNFSVTEAWAKPKVRQPRVGDVFTGVASNRGQIRLQIVRVYNSALNRVFAVPRLTWSKIPATCDIFDGTAFVPKKVSLTLTFYPADTQKGIKGGRFKYERSYNGQQTLDVQMTFTNADVKGTIVRGTAYDGYVYDAGGGRYIYHNCRYPKLRVNLAKN